MGTILLVIDIILAISITILVLMQRPEGGALGALGGGGGGSNMFTGRQAGNFLTRTTWWLFAIFVVVNLALVIMSKKTTEVETISLVPTTEAGIVQPSAPAAPANAPVMPVVPAQKSAGE